ncbi:MAG: FxDxF family PEP-CTERM protein [Sphingobium sp.]|nr:FxDxF family PEP-CTERM protein [Sphingobium sp.]
MLLPRISVGLAALAAAIGLASAASAATVIPVGSPNFFITSGTPFSPSVSAIFFNNYAAGESFDDIYTFTLPQNGVGSGSVSTSFSSTSNKIVLTDLIINGVSYAITTNASGQAATVGGIPISAFDLNSIELKGYAVGDGGYAGTATFTASAVPEPAMWAMLIAGFALTGSGMRRRRVAVRFG